MDNEQLAFNLDDTLARFLVLTLLRIQWIIRLVIGAASPTHFSLLS
jgi:hypothetical protein